MRHPPPSDGPTVPGSATATPDPESDGLAQGRLFYAERCENLIEALQFVSAVLRKTPAGGNETRKATAHQLAERLPPEELDAAFRRIDATWAAWTRPDARPRSREAVQGHARMALLAAVDEAVRFIHLSKMARAVARRRAGHPLSEKEEECLIQCPEDATVAAGLLDGKPHLVRTLSGDLQYERDEPVPTQTAADAEPPQPLKLVRWLTTLNGHPDLASKLTEEHVARLVRAWPKHAGRPRGGEPASWDVIRRILGDLGLGKSANVHKIWEAFRRKNGPASTPPSPKPRRRVKGQA